MNLKDMWRYLLGMAGLVLLAMVAKLSGIVSLIRFVLRKRCCLAVVCWHAVSCLRWRMPACTTSPTALVKLHPRVNPVKCIAKGHTKETPPMLAAQVEILIHCVSWIGRYRIAKLHVPKCQMFQWAISPILTFGFLVVGNAQMDMLVHHQLAVLLMLTAILSCVFRAVAPCYPVILRFCRLGSFVPFNIPAFRCVPETPARWPVEHPMWEVLHRPVAHPTTRKSDGSWFGQCLIATCNAPCRILSHLAISQMALITLDCRNGSVHLFGKGLRWWRASLVMGVWLHTNFQAAFFSALSLLGAFSLRYHFHIFIIFVVSPQKSWLRKRTSSLLSKSSEVVVLVVVVKCKLESAPQIGS